jgi:hypothetical protein
MSVIESIESRLLFAVPSPVAILDHTWTPIVEAKRNVTTPATVVASASLTKAGTLFIHGTDGRDRISIKQVDGAISVFANGAAITSTGFGSTGGGFKASLVKRVNISAGGGRDLITAQILPRITINVADSTNTDSLTRYTLDGTQKIQDGKSGVLG